MADWVDKNALKTLHGEYAAGSHEALDSPDYIRIARLRRRQLGQMTVAYDRETALRKLPDGPYHVSRKIDGEFTCLIYRDGEAVTLNPGGTLRVGAPFMQQAAEALKKAGVTHAVLGGELYVQRKDDRRPRVHDVVRVARAPANDDEVASLAIGFFNIYDLDGQDLSMRYGEAVQRLQALFGDTPLAHPVDTEQVGDSKGVMRYYEQWVEQQGEEGVVLRSDSLGVYKIKPRHSLDLAVIGFTESINEREGLLHDLLLAVVRDDNSFQLAGRVGGGFSEAQRAALLTQLRSRVVESDFHEVNSDRVAYEMIEPGLVVEIECLDLVSRTSRDNTIDRMVLEWNADTRAWEGVRRMPLVSIISPQFIRMRDDKQATPDDVSVSQLTDIVEIPDVNRGAEDIVLPGSEIIRRAVATKVHRGALMVRKLVAWETHKDEESREFPAYVLQTTDFSPKRKDPLQYDLRISSSRAQILAMFDELKAGMFVKGWEETGG